MSRQNVVSIADLIKEERPTQLINIGKDKSGRTRNIEVYQLSVKQVREFQEDVKRLQSASEEDDDIDGTEIQRNLLRMAVKDASKMKDEELDSLPIKWVIDISNEIVRMSGLNAPQESSGKK